MIILKSNSGQLYQKQAKLQDYENDTFSISGFNNNENKPRIFLYKPIVEAQELMKCAEKIYGQKVTDE